MASLSKATDGELTEFKRIAAEAGLDTNMIKGFNKKPELMPPWIAYGRELLAGKTPSGNSKAATASTKQPKLFKRADGSYGLRTVRRGLSDADIVAAFKAAGWGYVNPAIRSDRRLCVEDKPEIAVGKTRMLSIKNVVPPGSVWTVQKAVEAIGAPALGFDLEDLYKLVLEHREELLRLGVSWVVAPAARFRDGNGDECVVYAYLENRELYLPWVGYVWNSYDWFGSSKSR